MEKGDDIPNWADILEAISTAVSAITSVALIVVALMFREDVLTARRRPILTLAHDSKTDDAVLFVDPDPNYWLCLRVHNRAGRDMARRVQLSLIRAIPIENTAALAAPVPARPFLVADVDVPTIDIPANVSYRFIVTYVDAKLSDGAELRVEPRASSGRDVLPIGTYQLLLALTADNADATYWSIRLHLAQPPRGRQDLPDILKL